MLANENLHLKLVPKGLLVKNIFNISFIEKVLGVFPKLLNKRGEMLYKNTQINCNIVKSKNSLGFFTNFPILQQELTTQEKHCSE